MQFVDFINEVHIFCINFSYKNTVTTKTYGVWFELHEIFRFLTKKEIVC